MNVLVVDGSAQARARAIAALRQLTDLVIEAAEADLQAALRALADGRPDLVVIGGDLPDADCLDLIAAARRRDPAPATVVFAGTGGPEHGRRCLAAGADLYLPRGADLGELRDALVGVAVGRRPLRRPEADERFELLGRITAGVAHDLSNYLSVIELSLVLAQRRSGAAPPGPEVAQARLAMDSAARLTRSLLDYARGGAPARAPVDLGVLIRRTLELFGRVIPPHVNVVVALAGELPQVPAVAAELEQLLLNLILNACHAMPEGGELRVSVRADDPASICLEVADTGAGLPGEVAGAVGPVSPSGHPDRAGGGLGLGIVRAVVERHGGALRIAAAPGGGTCFGVILPTAAGSA